MSKSLVIVESPTKAKTIKRFLGKEVVVEASMGHIRDLPSSTLAVDTAGSFDAEYIVPKEKETVIKKLQKHLDSCTELWIATDEDREGEAIGWHLTETLKRKDDQPIKRIVFHEITKGAITEAVENPRDIDLSLVEAQQARRVLDRLVGYTLSPFLWSKVYRGLSAGRVQSVAVRIIVDREREIQAFNPEEYWTIEAQLETAKEEEFTAALKKKDGNAFVPKNEQESKEVVTAVEGAEFTVASVEEKDVKKNPPPPFTTSTLQQEAARKLGFSVKQTMVVAQQLYEGIDLGKGEGQSGLITYMRTDSVNLSEKALADAKAQIESQFGREYILSSPRTYKTKAKGAQEAHEAIRPTEMERTPESLKEVLDSQQLKLYRLIWNRTMATQMATALLKRVGADISADVYTFRATGQTVTFDGFLRVYSEGKDESDDSKRKEGEEESGDNEKFLPQLTEGDRVNCNAIQPEQHFTKPPPRYTEASLVRKLEEEGIGRPSTYAPTISTIQQRGYITKEGKQLVPQDIAFTVTDLLTEHFPDVVSLTFTATMEGSLDAIAEGKIERVSFLKEFFGPFSSLVEQKGKEISKDDVMKERIVGKDPDTGLEIIARTGRFGPYIQLGRTEDYEGQKGPDGKKKKPPSASIPKDKTKENIELETALALLSFPKVVGQKDKDDVTVNLGRFGPYIRCGKVTVALPKDMEPTAVDLDTALSLIDQAKELRKKAQEAIRTLGKDPTTEGEIQVKDGRYGPYVTDGKTNASLGKKFDADAITFEEAVELLEKKRAKGGKKGGWKKK